ncbi:MAG: hypothetical protein EOM64_00490 [Erysipelotrichia bacterium]|nr:hypothetical protein [Erysipelotrichia bacterium]
MASESEWYCIKCGSKNTGKFCLSCGTAKPILAERIEPEPKSAAESLQTESAEPEAEQEPVSDEPEMIQTEEPEKTESEDSEAPKQEEMKSSESATAAGSVWHCAKCGAKNTGRFCTNCAAPRPASEKTKGHEAEPGPKASERNFPEHIELFQLFWQLLLCCI